MREPAFVRKHQAQWQEFEEDLSHGKDVDPDRLASLFVDITDDLAYAAAQYPESTTHRYLNQIAARVHGLLYKNRRDKVSRLAQFWTRDIPEAFLQARGAILFSAVVFLLTVLLGLGLGLSDEAIVRGILGNDYVDKTVQNIRSGNPMGVYKESDGYVMFVQIALNNLFVMMYAVIIGLLVVIGPMFVLMKNGVMIGAFHALFFSHGEVGRFFLGVYVHGSIELSCIIVAAGAGFHIGNAILLPRTFTRMEAFRRGVSTAIKIAIGLVPLIVVAALFESFVTRLTEMPLVVNIVIVVGTLAFMAWYVLVLPLTLLRRQKDDRQVRALR
ncbi:MAG: stage II sporulation protein M [bacterium]|nr:stage II sporulation protein M [bacterium]